MYCLTLSLSIDNHVIECDTDTDRSKAILGAMDVWIFIIIHANICPFQEVVFVNFMKFISVDISSDNN